MTDSVPKLLCIPFALLLAGCDIEISYDDPPPQGQYDGFVGADPVRALAGASGQLALVGDSGTIDFGDADAHFDGADLRLETYRPTASRAHVVHGAAAGASFGWVESLGDGDYAGYVDSGGRHLDLDLFELHPGAVEWELAGSYASDDGDGWLWISPQGDVSGDDGLGCAVDGWLDAPEWGVAEGWLELDCAGGPRWSGPALAGARFIGSTTELLLIAADGGRALALKLRN
jgi:hypothetical protein